MENLDEDEQHARLVYHLDRLMTAGRWTRAALAKEAGLSHTAVRDIFLGKSKSPRGITLARIASVLNVDASDFYLPTDQQGTNAFTAPTPPSDVDLRHMQSAPKATVSPETAPVYSSAQGGQGDLTIYFTDIIEYRAKPPRHRRSPKLWGFYVVGDSMFPRIESGNFVWVDPDKTPKPNEEAVFVQTNKALQDASILVKRVVKSTAKMWTVMQFNPQEEFRLSKETWEAWLIVDIDLNR